MPLAWAGWLPLYRAEDGKPVGVVLQEGMFEIADTLVHRDRVEVWRGDGDHDGACVRRVEGASYYSTLPERQHPIDIRPQLVNMWGIEEITEWYRLQIGGSGLPLSRKEKQAAKTKTPSEIAAEVEAAYANAPVDLRKKMREMHAQRVAAGLPPVPYAEVIERAVKKKE